jgi:hypothetical protein
MMITYSLAQKVLIWLGEDDKEDNVSESHAMERTPQATIDAFAFASSLAALEKREKLNYRDVFSSDSHDKYFWNLAKLIASPWFERLWVLQEVAVSVSAEVICGTSSIPWRILFDGVLRLEMMYLICRTSYQRSAAFMDFGALSSARLMRGGG